MLLEGAATAACAVAGAWVTALGLLLYGSWRRTHMREHMRAEAPKPPSANTLPEGAVVRACCPSCGRSGGTTSGPLAPGQGSADGSVQLT